jgi:NhaP-type Na+/H+ or K+/H+ antiporter
VIALIAGILLSHVVALIRPLEYPCGPDETIDSITLEFSRLVLGVQLVIAGAQLPSRYIATAWRSLCYLLGPGLILMWLSAGVVIWVMTPGLSFTHALAVGACVAPTDPVLSNAIIKGRFAEANTPKPLQRLISAEAGVNDGLGYPMLFFTLFWIKYVQYNRDCTGMASSWFGETWGLVILFSVFYGAVVGFVARKLLCSAVAKGFVEEESSSIFVIALGLFVLGTSGILATDDILACFVVGCALSWDDQ